MNEKKTTITDIARLAKVSKSTVSRVLNESSPVHPEKREAVLAAMERLNYHPNQVARSLAGGSSMTLGVVTQNIGSPFYDSVTQGVIHGLAGTGFSPLFADGQWDPQLESAAIQTLLNRNVDGLIMVGGKLDGRELEKLRRGKPTIAVARYARGWKGPSIAIDNFAAALEVTRYLIRAGHRRIAHIMGIPDHQDALDRYRGYCEAYQETSLERDPELVAEGNFSSQSGVLAVESFLYRGVSFSAIFAANDEMAMGARLALYRRGIRVPEDVSIIGFDDQPSSAYMTPPLTTVRQPAVEMGTASAEALLKLLANEPFETPELKAELVIRESVARVR